MKNVIDQNNYHHAERVHRIFRGSMETVKWLRFLALSTEVISASMAAWRILCPQLEWSGGASLALTTVIAIGVWLRILAKSACSFSERCRRVAIRAYGEGKDVSSVVAGSLTADAPITSEWFAKKLPTQTLQEYYESTIPPGNSQLRYLYAHSAFYTWRLLRVCWYIYLFGVVAFGFIGFLVIYWLAAEPSDPSTSGRVLDLVCSIVFVFLTAKAVIACVDAKQSSIECRRIESSLLAQKEGDNPRDLMLDYDVERASAIAIPTLIYIRMRDGLKREWDDVKKGLA